MPEEEKPAEEKAPSSTKDAPLSAEPPPDKLKEWGLAIVIMTFLALVLLSFVMFIKGKM